MVPDDGATGSDGARRLDAEDRQFGGVSCIRCGYTEFYRGRSSREAVGLFVR